MFAADKKRIALLDTSERGGALLQLYWTRHNLVGSEQRADLPVFDLTSVHNLTLLRKIVGNHPNAPSIMLPLLRQDLFPLLIQLFLGSSSSQKALLLDDCTRDKHRNIHLTGSMKSPTTLQRPQTFGSATTHPIIADLSATFADLLIKIENKLFKQNYGRAKFLGQHSLVEVHEKQPLSNIIFFDSKTQESLRVARQQPEDIFKQRHIEIELLKRALMVARKRLATTKNSLDKTIVKREEFRQQGLTLKTELLQLQENNEAFRNHTTKNLARLSKERFDLECALIQLQEQLKGHKAIEQMQITSLQHSLFTAQDEFEQSRKAHKEREQALQATLAETNSQAERAVEALNNEIEHMRQNQLSLELQIEENQTRLAQLQAEHQQRELELQTTLDEANRSASEHLTQTEADISALQQQIQAKESSRQQLQQEKADLANCLQIETSRTLEFAQQAQALEEHKQRLEIELKAKQQAAKDADHQHNNAMASVKKELEQARALIEELRQSRQQLDESLQQAQAEFLVLQEQMNQTLETEKQQAREEQTRLQSVIEGLNGQLQTTRTEAERQLDEARRQAQTDSQIIQKRMNQALETEKQQAQEEQRRLQSVIERLNEQLQATRAEAQRQLDEARRQAQTDSQTAQERMNQAMEAVKQQAREEQRRLQSVIEGLNEQLQATHAEAQRQLDEARRQAQTDSQIAQERMNQALETEKQQAREEQRRLQNVIEELNEQLQATLNALSQQQDKGIELETLLEQERETSNDLQLMLKRTQKALKIKRARLSEAKHIQQKTMLELQQELKSSQETWEKAMESEVSAQVARQELVSLKKELEKEIINLQAQLQHQQENSDAILSRHMEENERLQRSLSEIQATARITDATLRSLKNDRESLHEAKAQFEDQLAKMQTASQTRETELITTIKSERQKNEFLRQELEAAKAHIEDPEALRRAEEEKAALKRKIEGLREVQLEMESQLIEDRDIEIKELHTTLKATETKLKKAEKLARQTEELLREHQIQESAIELLGEDLDTLTKEKESLTQERDRLKKELSEIQRDYAELASENDQNQSEVHGNNNSLQTQAMQTLC